TPGSSPTLNTPPRPDRGRPRRARETQCTPYLARGRHAPRAAAPGGGGRAELSGRCVQPLLSVESCVDAEAQGRADNRLDGLKLNPRQLIAHIWEQQIP